MSGKGGEDDFAKETIIPSPLFETRQLSKSDA